MNISIFLNHWREASGAERANKDSFLLDLCDALGVERPRPTTNDPEKEVYVFERSVARSREDGTPIGRIDLFRAGCFVLEAKQADNAIAAASLNHLGNGNWLVTPVIVQLGG